MKIERIISGMKTITHMTSSGMQEIKATKKAGYASEQETLAYVENYANENGFDLHTVYVGGNATNYVIVKK